MILTLTISFCLTISLCLSLSHSLCSSPSLFLALSLPLPLSLLGYLYKKSNRILNTSNTMFRRRWFVLHDNMIYWYKSSLEVSTSARTNRLSYDAIVWYMTALIFCTVLMRDKLTVHR
jgi:hypothetical protein